MKKILTILILLTSISFAETPREMGYKLLSNAKNIYKLDIENAKCITDTRTQEEISDIVDIWRNGGIPQAGVKINTTLIQIEKNSNNYILATGLNSFALHIVDNEKLCQEVVTDYKFLNQISSKIEKNYGANLIGSKIINVFRNPYSIKDIENPSETIQLVAVKNNGNVIEYIKNPSAKVKLAAVKSRGMAIEYIKKPTEEMQLIAVKRDVNALKHIESPSEKVQITALKGDASGIEYIQKPSEKIQLLSVNDFCKNIKYIKNPTIKVKELAKKKGCLK